ncbi:endonuclease VII domain-containing protein [Streptantibioticus ferralitis]|uniref:Endonuclease VII domain-containing protein n=1 Tax=Streptantibioticus ferralitis TaxID=236510 RepID=A0ABT5Z6Z7_9ACTN|nr:endonuclease VII domain-containing protein [Streptantibioticus ferralitis]MDF2259612.1 endonuclease VII domain-containing protein [Streptantibioticus ferralitis]
MFDSKKCSTCQRALPRNAFAGNKSRPDRLQTCRRECSAEHYRRRQEVKGLSARVKVPVPRGFKRCPQCRDVRSHDQWERNKPSSDGWASYCRACRTERNREASFRRRCGLGQAELQDLAEQQGRVCVICLAAPPEQVDHDHETGKVRGVLCFSCNAALGQFKDRPDEIRRAAAYVEGNVWKPTLVAPGVYQLPS